MTTYSRRQFLGALGAGTVASAGLAGPVDARETPVVEMGNNYFDPVGLAVEPGTTVRFAIAAGAHSATAYENRIPAGATAFDSGVISSGSFEFTFETPGTYDYYCTPHRGVGMVGRIVVGRPGGPAADSRIPDGSVPDSERIVEVGSVAYGSGADGGGSFGGMTGPGMGPGMMGGRTGGWGGLPLVGGALGMLGVAAGALYLTRRRGGTGEGDDPALTALRRRYARGDIDAEEFERRRERLADDREN